MGKSECKQCKSKVDYGGSLLCQDKGLVEINPSDIKDGPWWCPCKEKNKRGDK